jgi:uncharacterized protein YihD (DUF1040 family)
MRDPDRIDPILALLREVWTQSPDLRLGQLIVNAIRPNQPAPQVFSAEDDKLVEGLKAYSDMINKAKREATDGHT